jgi:hypothetical protein
MQSTPSSSQQSALYSVLRSQDSGDVMHACSHASSYLLIPKGYTNNASCAVSALLVALAQNETNDNIIG